jgi:hypothetical protein
MDDIRFGNPEEWSAFAKRHPRFLERFQNLVDTLHAAFPDVAKPSKLETVLYLTARHAVDDFLEILPVCGNAEKRAANKLLRSFFERVVLLRYLHTHPEKLEDYFEYYHLSQKKVIDSAIQLWGQDAFDAELIDEVNAEVERVKERYKARRCPQCGHATSAGAWTSVALYEMASQSGLREFIFSAYTLPLLEVHPSLLGSIALLTEATVGYAFADRLDREGADAILQTAHALVLRVVEVQLERFNPPGLEARVKQAVDDYNYMWSATREAGKPDFLTR